MVLNNAIEVYDDSFYYAAFDFLTRIAGRYASRQVGHISATGCFAFYNNDKVVILCRTGPL